MPTDPSPPGNDPGPKFHTARCCPDPQLECRWSEGLREHAFLTFWCTACATELLVLDPPGAEYPESDQELPAPTLPVPVVDLGSFQALVRYVELANALADQVAADAAELGNQYTAAHADDVRRDAAALEQLASQLLPFTQPIDGDTGGHTALDVHSLRRAGIDPTSTQPREHSVPCTACSEPTWNIEARCDLHYQPPLRTSLASVEAVPA